MTRKEQIRSAYRLTGGNASFYDGMMTYSTLPGKAGLSLQAQPRSGKTQAKPALAVRQ